MIWLGFKERFALALTKERRTKELFCAREQFVEKGSIIWNTMWLNWLVYPIIIKNEFSVVLYSSIYKAITSVVDSLKI